MDFESCYNNSSFILMEGALAPNWVDLISGGGKSNHY